MSQHSGLKTEDSLTAVRDGITKSAVHPPTRTALKGLYMYSCAADGCSNEALARYRRTVCNEHANAPLVRVSGEPQRWCKACKRLESPENFEGKCRTCSASRARSRATRQRRTTKEDEPSINIRATANNPGTIHATAAITHSPAPSPPPQLPPGPSHSRGGGSDRPLQSSQPLPSSDPHTRAPHQQAENGQPPPPQLQPQPPQQHDEGPSPEEEQHYFSPRFVTRARQQLSDQHRYRSDEDPPTSQHEAAPRPASSSQHREKELPSQPEDQPTLENEEAVLHTVAIKISGYEPHELSSGFRQALARWLLLRPVCFSTFVVPGCVELVTDYVTLSKTPKPTLLAPHLGGMWGQMQMSLNGANTSASLLQAPWFLAPSRCAGLVDMEGKCDLSVLSCGQMGGISQNIVLRTNGLTLRRGLGKITSGSGRMSVRLQRESNEMQEGLVMLELTDDSGSDQLQQRSESVPFIVSQNQAVVDEISQASSFMRTADCNNRSHALQKNMRAVLYLIGQGIGGCLPYSELTEEVESICGQFGWEATQEAFAQGVKRGNGE